MKKKKEKSRVSLDGSLLVLLALSLFSSLFTLHKFRAYEKRVDDTMKSNLEILQQENKRASDELREIVNLQLSSRRLDGSLSASSTNQASLARLNSSFSSSFSGSDAQRGLFRSLPSGLSIVRAGDWYVTDGIWKYGVGDMSPVGLITNIMQGVVMTEIDTFSYVSKPVVSVVRASSKSDKFEGGAM